MFCSTWDKSTSPWRPTFVMCEHGLHCFLEVLFCCYWYVNGVNGHVPSIWKCEFCSDTSAIRDSAQLYYKDWTELCSIKPAVEPGLDPGRRSTPGASYRYIHDRDKNECGGRQGNVPCSLSCSTKHNHFHYHLNKLNTPSLLYSIDFSFLPRWRKNHGHDRLCAWAVRRTRKRNTDAKT